MMRRRRSRGRRKRGKGGEEEGQENEKEKMEDNEDPKVFFLSGQERIKKKVVRKRENNK